MISFQSTVLTKILVTTATYTYTASDDNVDSLIKTSSRPIHQGPDAPTFVALRVTMWPSVNLERNVLFMWKRKALERKGVKWSASSSPCTKSNVTFRSWLMTSKTSNIFTKVNPWTNQLKKESNKYDTTSTKWWILYGSWKQWFIGPMWRPTTQLTPCTKRRTF